MTLVCICRCHGLEKPIYDQAMHCTFCGNKRFVEEVKDRKKKKK